MGFFNSVFVNIPIVITDPEEVKFFDKETISANIIVSTNNEMHMLTPVPIKIKRYGDNYIANFDIAENAIEKYKITDKAYLLPSKESEKMLILISCQVDNAYVNHIDREKYPFIEKKEVELPILIKGIDCFKAFAIVNGNQFDIFDTLNYHQLKSLIDFDSCCINDTIEEPYIYNDDDAIWKVRFKSKYFGHIDFIKNHLRLEIKGNFAKIQDEILVFNPDSKGMDLIFYDHLDCAPEQLKKSEIQSFSLRLMGNLSNVFYKYANTEKRIKATIIESLENPVNLFNDEVIFTKINFEDNTNRCYVYFEISKENAEKHNITGDCWFIFAPSTDEDDEFINLILRRPHHKYMGDNIEDIDVEISYNLPVIFREDLDHKIINKVVLPEYFQDKRIIVSNDQSEKYQIPVYFGSDIVNKDEIVKFYKSDEDRLWYVSFELNKYIYLNNYYLVAHATASNYSKMGKDNIILYIDIDGFILKEKEEKSSGYFYKIPLTLDTYDPKKVIRIEIPRRYGNFILESNKEINLDLPVNYEYKPDQVLNKDNVVNCFKDEEDGLWYITFTSEIEGLDKYVARGYYNAANSKKLENGDIIYYPAYRRFFLMEKKEESKPVISNKTKKREDYISWEEYFMSIAKLSARRSKDPNTQVGCCIEKDKKILSMGYNGFPNGCSDDEFPWDAENEDPMNIKDHYVVHAEINAILNYPGSASHLQGSTIWVTLFPCNECTKAIIQAGIKKVVYLEYKEGLKTETSKRMMEAAGVEYYSFDEVSLAKIGNGAIKQMDEIKPFGIKELGKFWEGISFSDKRNGIAAAIRSYESALYNPDFSKLVPKGITEEEYEYFLKTAIEIMKGKKVADKDFIIFCIKIMKHDETTPEQYKTNFIEILNQKVQIMEMMEKRQNELEEENKVKEKRKYDTIQIGMFYKDNKENTCFFVDEASISKHRKEISIYTVVLSTEHDAFYELVKNKNGYFIFPSVYIKYNSNIFENMYPIIGLESKEYIDADILDDRLHSGRIEMMDISYNGNHGEIVRMFKTYRDQYEKCTALKVSTTMKINEEEPGLS